MHHVYMRNDTRLLELPLYCRASVDIVFVSFQRCVEGGVKMLSVIFITSRRISPSKLSFVKGIKPEAG